MNHLFPMTLTEYEEHFLDHGLIVLELIFQGEIDRAAFEVGLDAALRRNPLFTALVERRRWRRSRWVSTGTVRPRIEWDWFECPVEISEDEGIDLTREVGVRFHVGVGQGRSRIVVILHHACCDGIGAIQFLTDLFTGYARYFSSGSTGHPAFRDVVPARLLDRCRFTVHRPPGISRARFLATATKVILGQTLRSSAPLATASCRAAGGARLAYPGALTRTIEERTLRALRKTARKKCVTVNDLLIRETLIVLRDWNRAHGLGDRTKRLGVIIPVNLRDLRHDGIPAANVMGFWIANRPVGDCDEPEKLLRSIHQERTFIKESRIVSINLGLIKWIRMVPGLLPRVMARAESHGAVALSNMGDAWCIVSRDFPRTDDGDPIVGNLVLRDVNSAAPLSIDGARAAFTIWHANDRLRIGLRCHSQLFSREDTQALLDLFAARIINLVDGIDRDAPIERAA